ncbi:MAG: transcription antitermination factor NusB, partial [Actinomycetales bacterium]
MDPLLILQQTQDRLEHDSAVALNPLVQHLVQGVVDHREHIDQVIGRHSLEWSLDRMPAVDRAILRVGCFELLQDPQTPPAVVIAEAVRLAGLLSTDESGSFVNGVLAAISRQEA